MTHELPTITGHPLEHWQLTNRGQYRHQRVWRFHVPTALCDQTFQLTDRPVSTETPACTRCVNLINDGYFDAELNLLRRRVLMPPKLELAIP